MLLAIVPARGDEQENCSTVSVANLTVYYLDEHLVQATWVTPDEGGACVSRYQVCLSPGDQEGRQVASQESCVEWSNTTWTGRVGRPCANYTLAVAALDRGGVTVSGDNITFISPPAPVRSLSVANSTSDSLLVSWVALEHDDACVEDYLFTWHLTPQLGDDASSGDAPRGASAYNVSGLRPCSEYVVVVDLLFAGGQVTTAQTTSGYTAAQGYPAMVSEVTVAPAASGGISVAWRQTSVCIEQYEVCVREFFHQNESCSTVPSEQLEWTSSRDLKPCTNYSIGVTAIDYGGKRSGTTFNPTTTAPGEVRDLSAQRTPDSMSITWREPESGGNCLKGYELYLCVHGNSTTSCDTSVATLGLGDTSYNATGLASCEDYDVVVKSVGAEGQSSYGTRLLTYTDVTDPSAVVSSLTVTARADPTDDDDGQEAVFTLALTANWTAAAEDGGTLDCIGGYLVCYEDEDREARTCRSVDSSVQELTVEAQFCTNYTVRLEPFTVTGRRYGNISTSIVTPPNAVQNLAARNASFQAIHVSWEPPPLASDCVRQYVVRWCPSEDTGCLANENSSSRAAVSAEETEYFVYGLRNCDPYLVWVTVEGTSGAESVVKSTTARAGYASGREPVLYLHVTSVSSQAAVVTWGSPREAAEYCVKEYHASLEEHYAAGGAQTLSHSTLPNTRGYWSSDVTLQPCTLYTLTVTPRDVDGSWMNNYTVSFLTAPESVRSLTATANRPMAAELRWVAPLSRTCLASYRVCWWLSGPGDDGAPQLECNETLSAAVTEFDLPRVAGCSIYTASVSAVGAIGDLSAVSNQTDITFTSDFADPGPLADLRTAALSSLAISVEWESPTSNQACVDDYEVCLGLAASSSGDAQGDSSCQLVPSSSLSWTSGAGLQACTLYNISVAYRHRTSVVDTAFVTQITAPARVENLTSSGGNATSAGVSWAVPTENAGCADEAEVCWCLQGAQQACRPSEESCSVVPASEESFHVQELMPCSRYAVSVVAVDVAANTSSERKVVSVHTSYERPTSVRNVSVQMDGSMAVVSWLPPALTKNCVASYRVCWGLQGVAASCWNTTALQLAIETDTCQTYEASVTTIGSDGSSSEPVSVSIDLAVPGMVENLVVGRRTCTTLAVAWDEPSANSDCVSGYEVCWRDSSAESGSCKQLTYEEIDTTIPGLEMRSRYEVTVEAVGPSGEKSGASAVRADTGPREVEGLRLSGRTNSTVSVSWQNPVENSGCVQDLVVSWCQEHACTASSQQANSAAIQYNTTAFTVTQLLPCSNYSVTVGVRVPGDTIPPLYSNISSHTSYQAPEMVENLVVAKNNCTSLSVEWDEPSANLVCVSGYEVCWTDGPSSESRSCQQLPYGETEAALPGLEMRSRYEVTVEAVGPSGEKSGASAVRADTGPREVEGLRLSGRTNSTVSVSWQNPVENSGCVQDLVVSWCQEHACTASSQQANSAAIQYNTTAFTVTQLLPCSNYSVTVGVRVPGDTIPPLYSNISSHTSYQGPVPVDEVGLQMNGSTAVATWAASSTPATCLAGYQVCWHPGDSSAEQQCQRTANTSLVFGGLPACEKYVASVGTLAVDGSLSRETRIDLDFATPGEVRQLAAANRTSETVSVTWMPPAERPECVSGYEVCHFEDGRGGNATCELVPDNATSTGHTVIGLRPDASYVVAVTALGPSGGEQSAASTIDVHAEGEGTASGSGGIRPWLFSALAGCCATLLLLGHPV